MTEFQKYVQRYLDMIPSGDWLEQLKISGDKTIGIYSNLTEEQSRFAYAEGKWTLKGYCFTFQIRKEFFNTEC
jgi:hypothetical protein